MWRCRMRAHPLQGAFARLRCSARPTSTVRTFSQQGQPPLSPVRTIGPVVWSIAAVGTICFTCAAYEVRRDVKNYAEKHRPSLSERDLDRMRNAAIWVDSESRRQGKGAWNQFMPLPDLQGGSGQVLASLVGINLCTLVPSMASPFWEVILTRQLAHIPAEPLFRYHQLLTSAFIHSGPLHMGLNMLVLYNFGPTVAATPSLQASGSAFLAFCLSAAVASSLGSHLSTLFWPNKYHRFKYGMGFSGVAMALVATTCVVLPGMKISVFPIPMQFEARSFLDFLKIFEALGVLGLVGRIIPSMRNVGFAAHLSGLLFGEAYGRWSGQGELWKSFRLKAFRAMKRLGAV